MSSDDSLRVMEAARKKHLKTGYQNADAWIGYLAK
jgi:hypothetical protein